MISDITINTNSNIMKLGWGEDVVGVAFPTTPTSPMGLGEVGRVGPTTHHSHPTPPRTLVNISGAGGVVVVGGSGVTTTTSPAIPIPCCFGRSVCDGAVVCCCRGGGAMEVCKLGPSRSVVPEALGLYVNTSTE